MKKLFILAFVLLVSLPLTGCGKEKAETPFPAAEETTKLQIKTIKEGKGLAAKTGDNMIVHYVGAFTNGTIFDSSREHEKPFHFTLGGEQVIAGWDQGMVGMKTGEIRRLIIPPRLGYGVNDFGPIPGNSTLIFEVELLEIRKNPVP